VGIYFRTDTSRLTFRELWHIASSWPAFLSGCANKVLGLRVPARWAVLHEEAIRVLPADEVPGPALRVLGPLVEDFEEEGARLVFYHTVPATRNLAGCAAVLLPPGQDALIVITWVRTRVAGPGRLHCGCQVASLLQDGTFLCTTSERRRFNLPPGFQVLRRRGATPWELLRLHRRALAAAASPPTLIRDAEQAKEVLVEAKRRKFDWQVRRGVWVPLGAEEQAALGLPPAEDL
jgi:hypothetical protein